MKLLNVSFGILVFHPIGWMIMAIIVLLECALSAHFLRVSVWNKRLWSATILANFVSGLVGLVLSLILTQGWIMMVWFPWSEESDWGFVRNGFKLDWFLESLAFLLIMILFTVLIEWVFYNALLRSAHPRKKILTATLKSNLITSVIGSLGLALIAASGVNFGSQPNRDIYTKR